MSSQSRMTLLQNEITEPSFLGCLYAENRISFHKIKTAEHGRVFVEITNIC